MKVAILAGGIGSRLVEETAVKPKAMVEIGGRPIIWHIMMFYSQFGYKEFVIALGYKGEYIKRWFREYSTLNGDMKVNTSTGEISLYRKSREDWIVHLVDTGETTLTGGRIKKLAKFIGDETFMLTWCDGLSDLDLDSLLSFHRSHGRLATLTAVRPPSRFGHMELQGARVIRFNEKPKVHKDWINGAFFVLEPEIFDYIECNDTMWEKEPLENLAKDGQLMAYRHEGFWQCMDTIHEKLILEKLWHNGKAPWKIWD